jgi:hypothetical protein
MSSVILLLPLFRMSQYCRNLLKIYVNLLYIAGHAPLQNIIKDMSETQTYFILLVMHHFKTLLCFEVVHGQQYKVGLRV